MTVDFFKQKYGHEVAGLWMPRVTAITSFVSKNNVFWGKSGTDWGTLVHKAVAKLLQGESNMQEPRILPSLNAFLEWQRAVAFEVLNPKEDVERLVVDEEHMYAGTIDVAGMVHGVFGLVDLKTSSGMREEYALQTAAYVNAYNKSAQRTKLCKTRWILRIDQYAKCQGCFAKQRERDESGRVLEGNPLCNHVWGPQQGQVEFKELENHEHDLQAFLSAKEVWEWYNRDWLGKITNYPRKTTQKILL
ncbi:MAG: Uncharacterized protein Greene071421_496 [Parcubacteria group bacterium Greene0714_21]|nr:MAG: Uncharacterized protein Greene041639_379 [Parcubacteria group bacterium Greene0416_39]TSC97321.1 MAG: Uncharacterized protein Greene101447_530 [Parcubacteria group bacterium Greene1014_47]TSD03951.1 MAG: Uncharacterized protein Greene071421_496 [Parcubacteria group bacterium Greene0714_21]